MQTGSSKKVEKDSLLEKWLNHETGQERSNSIEPRPEGVLIPLSLGQQRLLFLQQLYPENPFYNYADAYRFRGDLRVDDLIRSFEIVARKHEILRANFKTRDGKVVQEINESPAVDVSDYDLRDFNDEIRFEKARKLAIEEARKPFDLGDGSLTRVSILCLADDDFLVVLTMHHIIFDKWSMGILLNEVAENYQKLSNGEAIESASLEIQYADFAHWQKNQKPDNGNLNYWKQKLENSLEFLGLPTDFKRPNRPTFQGAYSTHKFSEEFSKKLKELSKQSNTTPYVLLLTAYKVLLHRYTGETDVLVGSPFTNRDRVELEKLIGFFNDTLVLRSDLSENPSFIELLEQVKQTSQDALTHKNMPFETLVKTLKPERFLNSNPLFQVMFIYHDTPQLPSFGDGLTPQHQPFDFGVTKFDLTLYISDGEKTLSSIFEYSKDLFEEKTIERMQKHFQNLLEAIVESPNQKISELSLITNDEMAQFDDWNDTKTNIEANHVIELFEKQVKTKSNEVAVSLRDEKLTYSGLNERANAVANCLLRSNLAREKPVGLFVESSLEMIVGILGILKAGFAYLPLDAEYPRDRIDFILKNSGCPLVFTQQTLAGKLLRSSAETKIIEEIIETESSDEPVLNDEIDREDLAYVIYTSGSTGAPKGVGITHENLASSTSARFEFYPKNPRSFLLLSSFSFDSAMAGIFWSLTTGGKLVLTERRIEQDIKRLGEIFEGEKITHTLLLPTLYLALLDNISNEKLRSLENVIVAGERCPHSLGRQHFESLPDAKLYNEYGPTEATVWATVHEIKPEKLGGNVPIGKPISNTQIYILDKKSKLCSARR